MRQGWQVLYLAAAFVAGGTTVTARKDLLLRRHRLGLLGKEVPGEAPFMVEFRVSIDGGFDSVSLAKELSTEINTPGSAAAELMGHSVARAFSGTFPPVEIITTTSVEPAMSWMPLAQTTAQALPTFSTKPYSTLRDARRALELAKENQAAYLRLQNTLTAATEAHVKAMAFGNPLGTTPLPSELSPGEAAQLPLTEKSRTLGRLIYNALVNTPPPPLADGPTIVCGVWTCHQAVVSWQASCGITWAEECRGGPEPPHPFTLQTTLAEMCPFDCPAQAPGPAPGPAPAPAPAVALSPTAAVSLDR